MSPSSWMLTACISRRSSWKNIYGGRLLLARVFAGGAGGGDGVGGGGEGGVVPPTANTICSWQRTVWSLYDCTSSAQRHTTHGENPSSAIWTAQGLGGLAAGGPEHAAAGTVPRFTVALSPAVAPVVGKYWADRKPVGPMLVVRYLIPAPEYEVTRRASLPGAW